MVEPPGGRSGGGGGAVQLAPLLPQHAPQQRPPAESSPLLAYPHTANGAYDGSPPNGGAGRWNGGSGGGGGGDGGGGGGSLPPAGEEQHRCRRAYGPRPLVVASVAIGAGSFAQGCVACGAARA
jgi:hypothetical protein